VDLVEPHSVNRRLLALLSYGHLATDLAQGAIPALLPLFKARYHLSYLGVGIIVLMANLSSSVIQPAFGLLSDRAGMKWLLPVGALLSVVGIILAVHASRYWLVIAMIFLSGLGVAAFHPEGYKRAGLASGERRATGMSYFSAGGTLGYGLGPAAASVALSAAGGDGMLYLLIVGVPAVFLLWRIAASRDVDRPTEAASAPSAGPAAAVRAPMARAGLGILALLITFVILRSWVQVGMSSFIPLYFTGIRHEDPRYAGAIVSVFLGSGAIGTLVGGWAADRWGRRITLIVSMVIVTPLLWMLPRASGAPEIFAALLSGMAIVSTFAVVMVMAQALIPERIGLISGLIIGFAVGTGGIGVSLLGAVADRWGLLRAMDVTAILPIAALAIAVILPPDPRPLRNSILGLSRTSISGAEAEAGGR
jgi:MFS transporter, FSR family, fosmidomycin resistance protein